VVPTYSFFGGDLVGLYILIVFKKYWWYFNGGYLSYSSWVGIIIQKKTLGFFFLRKGGRVAFVFDFTSVWVLKSVTF